MATFCCKYRVGPPPVVFAWGGGMGSGHRHPARWAAAHPHGPRRRRGPGRGAPTHERFVDDVLDALPRGGSWRLKRGCDRRLVRRPSPPAGHRLTWWRPPPGRFPPDPYPSGILDRRSWAILWPVAFPKPLRTGRKRRLRLSQEVRGRPPRWEISYLGRLLGADPSLSTVDQARLRALVPGEFLQQVREGRGRGGRPGDAPAMAGGGHHPPAAAVPRSRRRVRAVTRLDSFPPCGQLSGPVLAVLGPP